METEKAEADDEKVSTDVVCVSLILDKLTETLLLTKHSFLSMDVITLFLFFLSLYSSLGSCNFFFSFLFSFILLPRVSDSLVLPSHQIGNL